MIVEITKLNKISEKIISCAIEVHKELGPGLLENVYQKALCIELGLNGIKHEAEKFIKVAYKNHEVGIYQADIIVEDKIVIELKSTERDNPLFEAQLLSYMKLGGYQLGLLLNFNKKYLKDGLQRIIL